MRHAVAPTLHPRPRALCGQAGCAYAYCSDRSRALGNSRPPQRVPVHLRRVLGSCVHAPARGVSTAAVQIRTNRGQTRASMAAFCGHTCEHPLHRTHPHPSVCCVWPAEAARRVFPVCSTEQPQLHHSRQGLQARPQSSAHSGPPPVRRRVTECLLRRTRYRSESGRGWGGQLGDGNHRRRHRLLQLAGQLAGGEQSPAWPRCRSLGR